MRKEIKYNLPYRIEGVDGEIEIKVDFISQGVINNYAESQFVVSEALKANNRMAVIFELIAIEKETKGKDYEATINAYEKEYQECIFVIEEFNNNGFFKKRMEVLKRILLDNGYKDNEILNDVNFWEDSVDPFYLSQFLENAVSKDFDKKKAVKK